MTKEESFSPLCTSTPVASPEVGGPPFPVPMVICSDRMEAGPSTAAGRADVHRLLGVISQEQAMSAACRDSSSDIEIDEESTTRSRVKALCRQIKDRSADVVKSRRILESHKKQFPSRRSYTPSSAASVDLNPAEPHVVQRGSLRARKFSDFQVATMRQFFLTKSESPSRFDKEGLATQTGLTVDQIGRWFSNQRRKRAVQLVQPTKANVVEHVKIPQTITVLAQPNQDSTNATNKVASWILAQANNDMQPSPPCPSDEGDSNTPPVSMVPMTETPAATPVHSQFASPLWHPYTTTGGTHDTLQSGSATAHHSASSPIPLVTMLPGFYSNCGLPVGGGSWPLAPQLAAPRCAYPPRSSESPAYAIEPPQVPTPVYETADGQQVCFLPYLGAGQPECPSPRAPSSVYAVPTAVPAPLIGSPLNFGGHVMSSSPGIQPAMSVGLPPLEQIFARHGPSYYENCFGFRPNLPSQSKGGGLSRGETGRNSHSAPPGNFHFATAGDFHSGPPGNSFSAHYDAATSGLTDFPAQLGLQPASQPRFPIITVPPVSVHYNANNEPGRTLASSEHQSGVFSVPSLQQGYPTNTDRLHVHSSNLGSAKVDYATAYHDGGVHAARMVNDVAALPQYANPGVRENGASAGFPARCFSQAPPAPPAVVSMQTQAWGESVWSTTAPSAGYNASYHNNITAEQGGMDGSILSDCEGCACAAANTLVELKSRYNNSNFNNHNGNIGNQCTSSPLTSFGNLHHTSTASATSSTVTVPFSGIVSDFTNNYQLVTPLESRHFGGANGMRWYDCGFELGQMNNTLVPANGGSFLRRDASDGAEGMTTRSPFATQEGFEVIDQKERAIEPTNQSVAIEATNQSADVCGGIQDSELFLSSLQCIDEHLSQMDDSFG